MQDGTIRIGPVSFALLGLMCDGCEASEQFKAGTLPGCYENARDAGWRAADDIGGRHLCPACAGKAERQKEEA